MNTLYELTQPVLTLAEENKALAVTVLVAFLLVASTFLRIGLAKGKAGHVRRGFGVSKHPFRTHTVSGLLVLALGYAMVTTLHSHLEECASPKIQRIEQTHGAASFADYAVTYFVCFQESEN